jgi:sec-independent protein translocase protein TatC
MAMDDAQMSLTGHLEELRSRLLRSLIAVGVGFVAAYGFSEQIVLFLQRPLKEVAPEVALNYFSLMEPFITHLKAAFFAGLVVALPVIFYQLYQFIAPGLLAKERRYVVPFVVFGSIFFIAGAAMAFFGVLPFAVQFFLHFDPSLVATLNVSKFLGFCIRLMIAFGLVFQLPLIVFVLARLGLVRYETMARNRRYALLVAFVMGAVLTPPDPVTQTLMAMPLLLMYELSVWVARVFYRVPDHPEEVSGVAT